MALAGVHVECGLAGGQGIGGNPFSLRKELVWSETPASGSPTSNSAPAPEIKAGSPIFSISAGVEIWYAVGQNPNPSANPRRHMWAQADEDIFVKQGDRFAWVAA